MLREIPLAATLKEEDEPTTTTVLKNQCLVPALPSSETPSGVNGSDTDLGTQRPRASVPHRRAKEIFTETAESLAHPDITDLRQLASAPGWTLHQLRHSALSHAAKNGASTGTLMAHTGHGSVASLARYTRVSPDALTRWQANRRLARSTAADAARP